MSKEHADMPKDKGLDHTLQLLKDGYYFIMNRKDKYDSRIFGTKLLAEKAICLIGKEEAALFYDNDKFSRKDAAPGRIQKTLFGQGGVQGLDGEEHHHRKAMFMSLMTKENLNEIQTMTKEEWRKELTNTSEEEVNVYNTSKLSLTRLALRFTGVPFNEEEAEQWVDELSDMFENAADIGPKHWKARMSRNKAEDWMMDMVERVRNREVEVNQNRALYQFSFHQDLQGELLDKKIVAVELLNFLRPIVAIAVYMDFLVLALHDFPEEVEKLKGSDEEKLLHFVQEVRRYYPFFPFTTARVKESFDWNGYNFEKGTLVLLDLYGTNHDPDIWRNPGQFHPDRFDEWRGSPFDFIPQGGGEFDIGHRCAGEWITIDILKETLDYFVNEISFEFPTQDLKVRMNDIPALPESKMKIRNIKVK